MHWIIVCIGFEQLLSHTLPQNDSDILACGSECMFPLIETSLCAQALWVNVSRGLGRNPPSPYPSREQFAAKPKLGFTALNKPSHGTGQRARKDREWEIKEKGADKEIKKYHVGMPQIRWSACALYLFLLQDLKMEFGPFRVFSPCYSVRNWGKNPFYSCQYFPHMSSTRPSLPMLNLFSLSHIISRHKYSVCHSRLCSERPLSAYLYKMWICNSTVMKATLVTSFQHIILPQTHCETRSNCCVKAFFYTVGMSGGVW